MLSSLKIFIVAMMLLFSAVGLAATPITLINWQGEYFAQKQGAFYFQVRTKGFAADPVSKVIVVFNNMLTKDSYIANQKVELAGEKMMPIWKLPTGKYAIMGVVLVDSTGRKRQWRPTNPKSFVVKKVSVSNLGMWTLSPSGATDLTVAIEMTPNVFKESSSKKESSVAAVINGYDGLEQETFAGAKVKKAARTNYGSANEMRTGYTIKLQIAMFYSLNLFQHNNFAKPIADVLNAYDSQLRSCYTDVLADVDGVKGTVQFKFVLSKNTQSIRSLKHVGGTLANPDVVKCLYDNLMGATIPANANIIGDLMYTFDYKQE